MAQRQFRVFKTSDKDVIETFLKIAEDIHLSGTITLTIAQEYPPVSVPLDQFMTKEDVRQILDTDSSLYWRIQLVLMPPKLSILVERQEVSDQATISFPNDLDPLTAAKLLTAVQQQLQIYERTESTDKLLGNELAEFYRRREQGLLKLEGIAEKLIKDTEKYRQKVDQREEERRAEMEVDFDKRLQTLEKQYLEKDQQITKREEELERQKKELDDRSGRHARRQIYRDLKETLKERNAEFSLTKQTQDKRWAVHFVFWGLIAVIVGFAGFAYIDKESADWYRMSRLSAGMIGLAATLIWYIRWNDQWFREHAEEEFRLKRLDLDVDRASWIVEMALEFKDEKGSEIPPEIVDRLSQNLFIAGDGLKAVKHPTEDLYSRLLEAISSLKLNIPGVGEATIDRGGIKKLRKEGE